MLTFLSIVSLSGKPKLVHVYAVLLLVIITFYSKHFLNCRVDCGCYKSNINHMFLIIFLEDVFKMFVLFSYLQCRTGRSYKPHVRLSCMVKWMNLNIIVAFSGTSRLP